MKVPIILLIMLAFLAAGVARAEDGEAAEPSVKERIKADAKEAGHAIKKGAEETGHAIKKGARETGHAIKKGSKEAWSETKTTVHNATHRGSNEDASH